MRIFSRKNLLLILLLGGVAITISDCDEEKDTPVVVAKPSVPAGTGVVRGIVKLASPYPKSSDERDESVIADSVGRLKNAVVYIKNGPNIAGEMPTVTLDQKDARYIPHVLAVQTGQHVNITNDDPMIHNINIQATINRTDNFSQNGIGASKTIWFASPEFIHVKCDVHPWMSSYIAVFDHPLFAVTSADGSFKIDRLPAGTYTLGVWHERFGTLEKQITVGADSLEVNFDFKGP